MNSAILTSFTHMLTGEGDRISYTYSVVNEQGDIVSQNNRGNFVVTDQDVIGHIRAIQAYITENKLPEG